MRSSIAICSLLLLTSLGAAVAKADSCNGVSNNLVSNCSFETGSFSSWNGTTPTDGYSYVGTVDAVNQSLPYAGSQQAFLAGFDTTSTLSQSISTVAGTNYVIEFALANDLGATTGYNNSFSAAFGGSKLLSETNVAASGYNLFTFNVAALSNSSLLSFTNENDGGAFQLDSVSVAQATLAPVPEPSSLLLLGTGLVAACGVVRRRLQS